MRHTDEITPLLLQSFTYDDRASLLPSLGREVDGCGGWVLSQRTLSPAAIELHIEVQTRELIDLYAALLRTGLELTRGAHLALSSGCTRGHYRQHLPAGSSDASQAGIATLRLEITFLSDPMDSPGILHRLALQAASA